MGKAQLILVGLALIAFFATGGIDKASKAIITAKEDFSTVKGKVTDFQQSIIKTTKAQGKDQVTQKSEDFVFVRNGGFEL